MCNRARMGALAAIAIVIACAVVTLVSCSQAQPNRIVVYSECGSDYLPLTCVNGSINNVPNKGNYQGLASDGTAYLYQVVQKASSDSRVFRLGVEGDNRDWMTFDGEEALSAQQHGEPLALHANGVSYISGGYLAMTGAGGILVFRVDGTQLVDPRVIKICEDGQDGRMPGGIAVDNDRGVMYAKLDRDVYEFAIPPLDQAGVDEGVTVNGVAVPTIVVDVTAADRKTTLESAEGSVGVQGLAYDSGRLYEFNQFSKPESEGRPYRYDSTCFDAYNTSDWNTLERKEYLVSRTNAEDHLATEVEWREVQGMAFANGVQYVANAIGFADGTICFVITTTGDSDPGARSRVDQVDLVSILDLR